MMHPYEAPDLSQPLIISAALTGSWPTKAQNPNLPVTEEEIAEAAVEAASAGAAIVHIHVRNEQEKVTCDPTRYAKVRSLIRQAGSDVIINMSTGGGAGQTTDEQRAEPVHEAFVLDLRDGSSIDLCPTHWSGAGRLYQGIVRKLR